MLWYKGWLETRVKLLLSLGYMCFILALLHSIPDTPQGHGAKNPTFGATLIYTPSFVVLVCTWLAGAGIATQSASCAAKGLHGSTLFTLSLPVSRLRLLAVRAGLGWLELAGVIGMLCCGMWLVYPPVRGVMPVEMFEYAGTLVACGSAFYFFSVFLATFLEDQWRMMATILPLVGLGLLSNRISLPASADIFRAMGKSSPLIAHTIPWTPMAFSLGLAAILFFAALKIAQPMNAREPASQLS